LKKWLFYLKNFTQNGFLVGEFFHSSKDFITFLCIFALYYTFARFSREKMPIFAPFYRENIRVFAPFYRENNGIFTPFYRENIGVFAPFYGENNGIIAPFYRESLRRLSWRLGYKYMERRE
jgi:hypothetical protein